MPEAPVVDRPVTQEREDVRQEPDTSPTGGAEKPNKVTSLKNAIKGLKPFAALKRIAAGKPKGSGPDGTSTFPGQDQQQEQSTEPGGFFKKLNERSKAPFADELQRMDTQPTQNHDGQTDTQNEATPTPTGASSEITSPAAQTEDPNQPEPTEPSGIKKIFKSLNERSKAPFADELQNMDRQESQNPDRQTDTQNETTTTPSGDASEAPSPTAQTESDEPTNQPDSSGDSSTQATNAEGTSPTTGPEEAPPSQPATESGEPNASADDQAESSGDSPAPSTDTNSPDNAASNDTAGSPDQNVGDSTNDPSSSSEDSTATATNTSDTGRSDTEASRAHNPEDPAFLNRVAAEAVGFGLDINSEKGKAFIELVKENPDVLEHIDEIKSAFESIASIIGPEGSKQLYEQIPDILQTRINEANSRGDTQEATRLGKLAKALWYILAGGTLITAGVSLAGVGLVSSGMGGGRQQ